MDNSLRQFVEDVLWWAEWTQREDWITADLGGTDEEAERRFQWMGTMIDKVRLAEAARAALATEGGPQRDMTAGEWRGAYMELARICEEKIGAVERVARQAMTGIHARDRHSGFWQECPVDYCEAGGLDRGPLPAGSFLATEREPQNRTHVPWCRYDRDHRGRCNEFATEGEPPAPEPRETPRWTLAERARLLGIEDLARELVDRWNNGRITRPEAEIVQAMADALAPESREAGT